MATREPGKELEGLYKIGPYRVFKITARPRSSRSWLFVGSESGAKEAAVKIGQVLGATAKITEMSRYF